jgi:hypothetical protein
MQECFVQYSCIFIALSFTMLENVIVIVIRKFVSAVRANVDFLGTVYFAPLGGML